MNGCISLETNGSRSGCGDATIWLEGAKQSQGKLPRECLEGGDTGVSDGMQSARRSVVQGRA